MIAGLGRRRWCALALLMAATAAWSEVPGHRPIRVAIFDDLGGSNTGPENCELCLPATAGFKTQRVTGEMIQNGVLQGVDVLIQPGGSGSRQAQTLRENGRENIRQFVKKGGGYIGICAGAYLASADYDWSLHLLDAKVLDRKHWARGRGDVQLKLAPAGREFFGVQQELVTAAYAQGPLLAPADKPEIPDYEPLALFETEVALNGAPKGVMKGTTAAARGVFGDGRVFCFSPHPERSPGIEHFVPAAVRWAAKTNPADYRGEK